MFRFRWVWVLSWFIAAGAVASVSDPAGATSSAGVVWLTGVVQEKQGDVRLQAPLEWLAEVDAKDEAEIRLEDQTIDCIALWGEHQGLEPGKTQEVRRGTTKEGRPYILKVESRLPSTARTEGKVRILVKEKGGKTVDLGFPLDLPSTIGALVDTFSGILGIERKKTEPASPPHSWESVMKLGNYGPFVLLDAVEEDGGHVTISIE